ncbi:MAG: hypothetical protein INR71_05515, partial [Terriglobus roseus]|nr:hypothetical protein [Terriglobus roseus]
QRFQKALAALPDLKVDTTDVSALGLSVSLRRQNAATEREYRMYAPRYPKPQTEGFFVLVSDAGSGDVLALKRVGWAGAGDGRRGESAKPSARASVKIQPAAEVRKVNVAVVSDGYIGMEWNISGVEIPAAPVVVDDGLKKG